MIKFNIDSSYHQETRLKFEEEEIKINVYFNRFGWFLDLEYKEIVRNGVKLVSSVPILSCVSLPFDFYVYDFERELDPFALDSFSSGNFEFYLIERDELAQMRGFSVR